MELAGDFPSLEARRADVEPLRGTAHHRPNPLDVGVEASPGPTFDSPNLGAFAEPRDPTTESRPLGADVTDGGHSDLPVVMKRSWRCRQLARATAQE